FSLFFFLRPPSPRALHSFPTRRSSDLSFSRGLHQRLGLARVMLHDPSLILLDEPYTGLDANAVDTLNQMLDEAISAGKTIILTTDRKSTRLNSSHVAISYAVFCLKKKK